MGFWFSSTELTGSPWVSHITPGSQMVSEASSNQNLSLRRSLLTCWGLSEVTAHSPRDHLLPGGIPVTWCLVEMLSLRAETLGVGSSSLPWGSPPFPKEVTPCLDLHGDRSPWRQGTKQEGIEKPSFRKRLLPSPGSPHSVTQFPRSTETEGISHPRGLRAVLGKGNGARQPF